MLDAGFFNRIHLTFQVRNFGCRRAIALQKEQRGPEDDQANAHGNGVAVRLAFLNAYHF